LGAVPRGDASTLMMVVNDGARGAVAGRLRLLPLGRAGGHAAPTKRERMQTFTKPRPKTAMMISLIEGHGGAMRFFA